LLVSEVSLCGWFSFLKAEVFLFDRDDILMLKILEIPFVTFPSPIRPYLKSTLVGKENSI
jgi:hypothetical protein